MTYDEMDSRLARGFFPLVKNEAGTEICIPFLCLKISAEDSDEYVLLDEERNLVVDVMPTTDVTWWNPKTGERICP